MRGDDLQQHELFSYGSLEERVPADHPLRPIRTMVDEALKALDGRFNEIYGEDGRKSIPPERLLRALLLQMFYTIRSERMLRSNSNTTCCSVGLSGCRLASRFGTRQYSRRTATGCWKGRWPKSSSPSSSTRHDRSGC
jgi:hypothetical protein